MLCPAMSATPSRALAQTQAAATAAEPARNTQRPALLVLVRRSAIPVQPAEADSSCIPVAATLPSSTVTNVGVLVTPNAFATGPG